MGVGMCKKKKKRKTIRLTNREALRRLYKMVGKIEADVRNGLWAQQVLEAGNDLIKTLPNKDIPGAQAYNVIRQGLLDPDMVKPKYGELFALLKVASDIIGHSTLALHGRNLDLSKTAQFKREAAEEFWRAALAAGA